MHQPDLPAPPSRRPDAAALLLEAVSQRRTRECLALAQQWVHRRGIADLQRFCANDLRTLQGEGASAWLLALLARDTTGPATDGSPAAAHRTGTEAGRIDAHAPLSVVPEPVAPEPLQGVTASEPLTLEPLPFAASSGGGATEVPRRATAAEPLQQEAPVLATAAEPVPLEAPGIPTAAEASMEASTPGAAGTDRSSLVAGVHSRAEEAVDAAFAALAETFAEVERSAGMPAEPAPPAATIPPAAVPEALVPPPAPIPPRAGVWPSASHSALAVASALQAQAMAAEAFIASPQDGPLDTPSAFAPPTDDGAQGRAAHEENTAGSGFPPPAVDEPEDGEEVHPDGAATSPGVLIGRLRERLSQQRLPRLSRLRAVMRDCVDETMALLRGSDTLEAEDETQDAFLLSPVDQAVPPAWDPLLEGFPAPIRVAEEIPTARQPDPAPRAEPSALQPGGPTTAEAAVTGAARLRRDLQQRHPGTPADRPAPAPSSLSDLCGWLPERDDHRRAS